MTTLRATWQVVRAMFRDLPDIISAACDRWVQQQEGAETRERTAVAADSNPFPRMSLWRHK